MKAIGWLMVTVLALIVALGLYLVVNSGNLVKQAVETLGPEYLGVDVRLGAAEISFTEGTGELRGLVVGNPPGFDGPHSFSFGRIKLGLDPMDQSEDLIVVRDIEIDSADLAIIAHGRQTNLAALMTNLEGQPAEATDPNADSAPKIIIENFVFSNARTSFDSDLLGDAAVEIPDIQLQGIGRKSQGVTIREALSQLLRPIVQASTEALARQNLDGMKASAQEQLDEELDSRLGTNLDSLKDRLK